MRYLVSPPTHFDVAHLFNPWMTWREEVSPRRAKAQWRGLCDAIVAAGAQVDVLEAHASAPAMTFTRDIGIAIGQRFLIFQNNGPRGEEEPALVRAWLDARGIANELVPFPLEGGNVLPVAEGRVLVGVSGSEQHAERYLAKLLQRLNGPRCIGLPLVETPYVHLDLALADLGGRGWLMFPPAFGWPALDDPRWRDVLGDRPVIEVSRADAERMACNVVVVGETVIGGWIPAPIHERIVALGLRVIEITLDEFRKAGGGAHCLCLESPNSITRVERGKR